MKLLLRLFLVLVLLLVVGVFALNWFLEKGLTPAIRQALPAVEEKLGAPVEVGGASVSLFAGSVTLEKVAVGNPEGFSTPHLFTLERSVQDVAVWPLLSKREIRVEEVTIERSDLTVVRNPEGAVNLKILLANLREAAPPPKEEEPPAEPRPEEKEPGALPPFQLEQLLVTSLLTYVQEKEDGDPFRLGLDLEVRGEGIGTIGEPTDRGTLGIDGNLAGNRDLFVIGIEGEIAPIVDPLQPTFELKGKVDSVELDLFEVFAKEFKLKGGMMGLDMVLHANEGVFDPEKSVVRVLIDQPDLGSGLGIPAGFRPASLSFPLKVAGTVQQPEVDFRQGLRDGIRNALSGTDFAEKAQEKIDEVKERGEAAVKNLQEEASQAGETLKKQASEAAGKLKEDPAKALEVLEQGESSDGEKPSLPDINDAADSLNPFQNAPSDKGDEQEEKKGLDSLFGG